MKRLAIIPALLFCSLFLTACTGFLFYPMQPHVLTPAQLNLQSEDAYFPSGELSLHGWWLRTPSHRKGTIVFLHGNAQNISTHIASVFWLPEHGYDVFLFDYRGYGKSQGTPTLAGLHEDFHAALAYVFTQPGIQAQKIILFGQSLGAAIGVVGLAASPHKDKVHGLIIEGAFSEYRAIAREKLAGSWLTWLLQWPLSLTINNDYKPLESIGRIAPTPVLIIHSESDEVIPFHHARRLYEAAQQPKTLWPVQDLPHIQTFRDPQYQAHLLEWLAALP